MDIYKGLTRKMGAFTSAIVLFLIISSCATYKQKEVQALRTVSIFANKQRSQYEATGKLFMITTQGEASSKAGALIFEQGGNIIDAATAVSFAISVERPQSTGIGGGGFLLYYDAKKTTTDAVDFREMAPMKSHKKMYLDEFGNSIKDAPQTGGLAVATPGMVKGILEIHKKYGRLKLHEVLKPAIELADKGFKVYPALAEAIKAEQERLLKFKDSKKIFFNKNGEPLQVNELLIQKDLAKTLKLISKQGSDVFYKGIVGQKIINTIRSNKGIMTKQDLNHYEVKWRTPVVGNYNNYKIVSMPPSSSGGTHVVEILNILENQKVNIFGVQSSEAIHRTAAAMQLAFADRAKYMGDPDFVNIPVDKLVDKKYAQEIKKIVPQNSALSSEKLKSFEVKKEESPETTHFTIIDNLGNVVSSTQTINGWFGSAMVAEGTGIVLNNEMDDFATQVGAMNMFGAVGGENNLPEPKKRPLSSMSPTIVFKDNRPFMSLGTPSGTRIITCVAQTILNRIEHKLNLWDSVTAIRYHHQWYPEEIRIEEPGMSPKVEEQLKNMGYKINKKDLGCKIQAIEVNDDGTLLGVSDPREEGMALGK